MLDPENRGYLEESTLHELLTSNEFAFRDKVRLWHRQTNAQCAQASRREVLQLTHTQRRALLLRRAHTRRVCAPPAAACMCPRCLFCPPAQEWEDFCRVAKDPDTNYIHYEVSSAQEARRALEGGGGGSVHRVSRSHTSACVCVLDWSDDALLVSRIM